MSVSALFRRFAWGLPAIVIAACIPVADVPAQVARRAPAQERAGQDRPTPEAVVRAAEPPDSARAIPAPPRPTAAFVNTIRFLGREFSGKVGIAVERVDAPGWRADWQGSVPMPQQSVSKLWVALTALDAVDQGRLSLDQKVLVTRSDLTLFHQPIASLVRGAGYRTDVDDLLTRAMTQSDNTANDKLLNLAGGPEAVRRFITGNQLGSIRFGPGERLLQARTAGLTWTQAMSLGGAFYTARSALPMTARRRAFDSYVADPIDGASASAIASALARLKRGSLLSARSTRYLIGKMESSRTGRARFKAATPPGWTLAHKTGTGQNLNAETAGFNDVGLLTAPDGTSYAVAVLIGRTARPVRDRQALMQAVVATIVSNHKPDLAAS